MDNKYWLADPEEHDFPAARDYLELHFSTRLAKRLTAGLQRTKTVTKKAKDVLRASGLPLLPPENVHVKENLKKVARKKKLSPILLVSGERLIVADGYHRMCAIYYLSEDLDVPCRIVNKDDLTS